MQKRLRQTVECRTSFGEVKQVPPNELIFRPAVYGLIVHEEKILLVRHAPTQKYIPPGGGIDKGEQLQTALHREIMEETGITVEIGDFLHVEEDFYYYEPTAQAVHGFMFIYECQPLEFELSPVEYPPEEALDRALWVDMATLEPTSFLRRGEVIVPLIRQLNERASDATD